MTPHPTPRHQTSGARRRTHHRIPLYVALAAGVLLITACSPWRLSTAKALASESRAYTQNPDQPSKRLLVVGDSTAVGTGADAPQDSLPGRIGQQLPQWRIDNLAANGARLVDVVQQLERAPGGYDMVLVLAGGNDVIRFTAQDTLRDQLQQAVVLAKRKGQTVVLMPCGDVGHAPFFWPPVSWIMSRRSANLHAVARAVATEHQVRYVSLLKPREQDPFVIHSKELHSADGLHPSSAGYREWHRELVAQGGLAPTAP